jgi:hypothetical protein
LIAPIIPSGKLNIGNTFVGLMKQLAQSNSDSTPPKRPRPEIGMDEKPCGNLCDRPIQTLIYHEIHDLF